MRILFLLLGVAALSACTSLETYIPTAADFRSQEGKARVKIDISEQRASLYRNGDRILTTRVSTGKAGHGTPVGSYRITQMRRDHRSSLYGDYVDADGNIVKAHVDVRKHRKPPGAHYLGAPMPYFMRFHGAIGMHAGNVPYYPASHGCVRLPPRMARSFFKHVEIGTPVQVVP